jgi:hypothetical protein
MGIIGSVRHYRIDLSCCLRVGTQLSFTFNYDGGGRGKGRMGTFVGGR